MCVCAEASIVRSVSWTGAVHFELTCQKIFSMQITHTLHGLVESSLTYDEYVAIDCHRLAATLVGRGMLYTCRPLCVRKRPPARPSVRLDALVLLIIIFFFSLRFGASSAWFLLVLYHVHNCYRIRVNRACNITAANRNHTEIPSR